MPILIKDQAINDALEMWGSLMEPKYSKSRLAHMILEAAIQGSCPHDDIVEEYGGEQRWANVKRGGPRTQLSICPDAPRLAALGAVATAPPKAPKGTAAAVPPEAPNEGVVAAAPPEPSKPIVTRPPGMRPIAT